MTKQIQIPFDENGNQLSYPYYGHIMKDNYEFEDDLQIIDVERGRSACIFIAHSKNTGKKYKLFLSSMLEIINNTNMHYGEFSGKFTFIKRGAKYSLKLLI